MKADYGVELTEREWPEGGDKHGGFRRLAGFYQGSRRRTEGMIGLAIRDWLWARCWAGP